VNVCLFFQPFFSVDARTFSIYTATKTMGFYWYTTPAWKS
jgi:hypothetical protein